MGPLEPPQDFQRAEPLGLLERCEVVRTSMMCCTPHLDHCPGIILHSGQPWQPPTPSGASLASQQSGGLTRERPLAEIQDFLHEKPRTNELCPAA